MFDDITRRDFIKTTGAASLGAAVVLGAKRAQAEQRFSPNDIIGIGIIGTGSRGRHLMQNIMSVPGVKITALCDDYDRNLKKGVQLVGDKVSTFVDYRELLQQKSVDAVIIATPLHLHAQMSIDALSAGKDVFCEKTMAFTPEQCQAMVDAVHETGHFVQVGHQRRYSPLYRRAVQLVQEGAIGKITCIKAQWHRNGDWRRAVPDPSLERKINWRLYREFSGGLMTELCSHQLHVANWFMGERPNSVMGIGGIDFWRDGREVYDNVNVIFNYPSGVRFTYTSITRNAYYGASEQIMGEEGTIELTTSRAKLFREKPPKRSEFKNFVMGLEREFFNSVQVGTASFLPEDPNKDIGKNIDVQMEKAEDWLQLESFVKCVRIGEKPLCNVQEGFDASIPVLMGVQAMDMQELVLWPKDLNA